MPIEAIAGLQLALYGLGWALAAVYLAEERAALSHWAAYALLQAASAWLAAEPMAQGLRPPLASLVLSVLGFVAATRGIDLFARGRATLDRWLLPLTVLTLLPIMLCPLWVDDPVVRRRWQETPYAFGLGVLLLTSVALLWRPLRRRSGTLAAVAALLPSALTGLTGLASGVMHLVLGAPALGQVQQAARVPQVLASLVASAVFNFGYLFLLLGRLISQWRASARQDHLTGLPNRRAAEDSLAVDWARHQRQMGGLSLALIDVDHFKSINDRHGHARGDEVLVFVARHLQSRIRVGETLGRWGGEEFLLSMPGSSLAAAQQACDRLRESLRQAALQTLGEPLTVSIGVTQARPGEASTQALIDRADQAMYGAKAQGRDRVVAAD